MLPTWLLFTLIIILLAIELPATADEASATTLRLSMQNMLTAGDYKAILKTLSKIEQEFGTLVIDVYSPSLFMYRGVAFHGLHELEASEKAFQDAVLYFPNETRSWINLGEVQTLLLKFNHSVISYEEAYRRGEKTALPRLLTAKGWVDSWQNFEFISSEVEKIAKECNANPISPCFIESAFGLEYTDIPVQVSKSIHANAPITRTSEYLIHPNARAIIKRFEPSHRLRVGVISSDFGVHPVSSLVRGVLTMINTSKIELFCFSVTDAISWWRYNLSASVEHFDVLKGVNSQDGASLIAARKIDILIDLNGHTKNSGLSYLSHRPAPIQISFLGLPSTTSASYIDYYIGDYVALPPEHRSHFTEHLLLLTPCYIANDYAQLQGDVVNMFSNKSRASRKSLGSDIDVSTATFLFGTISNSQKMNEEIFHVWMNILRRFTGSVLSWTQHTGMLAAMENLRMYGMYYGVSSKRLVVADLAPWLDHLYKKTAVDMFLDTSAKNGHTTGLDGIWAGVPTVTLGGGGSMPTRAGESIASALGNDLGVTYSLKEYEDFVYSFCTDRAVLDPIRSLEIILQYSNPSTSPDPMYVTSDRTLSRGYGLLRSWRNTIQGLRTTSKLFDTKTWTKEFEHLLQATWDITSLSAFKASNPQQRTHSKQHFFNGIKVISTQSPLSTHESVANQYPLYHLFSVRKLDLETKSKEPISLSQAYDPESEVFVGPSMSSTTISADNSSQGVYMTEKQKEINLPVEMFSTEKLLFINIGGINKVEGWLNVNPHRDPFPGVATHTDILRPMGDLYGFPNESVSAIYSCHVLEHNSIGASAAMRVLQEWRRVLRPGGLILISVPDLRALARLYLDRSLTLQEKWTTTMMIYGSQVSEFDYHMIGFDERLLSAYMHEAGFCNIQRVGSFRLFDDASDMEFKGYRISLNIAAKRCSVDPSKDIDIDLQHNAEPFDRSQAL